MNHSVAMTRTERTYYVVFGGYTLAQFFIAPVYPLFLLSRGLDLFQMNAVLATYLITVFVFEVPTGAIADRFSRKTAFLSSCVIRMGAYGLYARAHGFADCLVAEFIDAVGTTLASGALDAWVVDGVRADGDTRPTDRLFARAQVVFRTVMIVGGVACGYVAELGWAVPWLVCAGMFALTAIAGGLLMHEARPAADKARRARSLGGTALAGVAAVRRAPVLRLLCALALTAAFAGFPLYILWQPRVQPLVGGGLWPMGWILALINVAGLTGGALVPRLLRRFEREVVLAAAALWRSTMLVVAATATGLWPMLAGLLLQEISLGLSDPVLTAWTNEHVAADYRATVLSVRSTFFTLGGATGLLAMGLVARGMGIPVAWAVSAAVVALMAPGYLALGRVARQVAVSEVPTEVLGTLPTKAVPPMVG